LTENHECLVFAKPAYCELAMMTMNLNKCMHIVHGDSNITSQQLFVFYLCSAVSGYSYLAE